METRENTDYEDNARERGFVYVGARRMDGKSAKWEENFELRVDFESFDRSFSRRGYKNFPFVEQGRT